MVKAKKRLGSVLLFLLMLTAFCVTAFAATTVEVLDGQITVTDTATSMSVSGDVVTVTAKGGSFNQTTNTITIYNETENKQKISFCYSASNYSSFSESSASGDYSVTLAAGEGIEVMSIRGKKAVANNTATLILSNFTLERVEESFNVTFCYDSTLGGVNVDGASVAGGSTLKFSAAGATVTAAPADGATFLGWIDTADNSVLSTSASFTFKPTEDVNAKPVFITDDSAPYFMVGSAQKATHELGNGIFDYYIASNAAYFFNDLNDAAAAAKNSDTAKLIVLMNSGTLPAGDYEIPVGVTLLIPFDSNNTLYYNYPESTGTSPDYTTPTPYRTLTMAEGANLAVNGSMSLSCKHTAGNSNTDAGVPTGAVSLVKMESGSNITVGNGGALYAWGYIMGDGTVTARSGSAVYEMFQLSDFRGGNQSSNMNNSVFPTSQYYVQNIEVPMTIYAGAREYSYITLYMDGYLWGSAVNFIGPSDSMFHLTGGYAIKDYDETTDRMVVTLEGNMSIDPLEMDMGSTGLDSSDYDLPVTNHITIQVNSGNITLNQDIVLYPGAEFFVGENATCTLGSGVCAYIYDLAQWIYTRDDGTVGGYCGTTDQPFIPLIYAPGREYTRTVADLKDAKVQIDGIMDAGAGYVYTTSGGADICSSGNGKIILTAGMETVHYQLKQAELAYAEIPITTAKLKNADGSYTQTGSAAYSYKHGVWYAGEHTITDSVTDPTCTEQGYTTHICVCGYSYADSYEDAIGHSYSAEVIAPDCTQQGYTTYTCGVCSDTYDGNYTDATGHSYGQWVSETAPTCETPGVESSTCTSCGVSETREVAAPGHSYESVETAPTCTAGGYITYTCTSCGDSYVEDTADATGHSYEAVITAPTCSTQGYTTHTCSACGDSYVSDKTAALGHKYASVVTAPTCTAAGYTTHTCSVCKDSYADSKVAATGHSFGSWTQTKAPSCTQAGEKSRSCACGETETQSIAALGHTEVTDAAVAATCTETGLTEGKHCSVCSAVLVAQEEVAALGHTEVIDEAVAPTVTTTGLTEGKHCSACNTVLTAQEVIPCAEGVIDNWSMTLGSELTVNFGVRVNDTSASIVISVDGVEKDSWKVSDLTDKNGIYYVSVAVAAAQMNDDISVQISNENGDIVAEYAGYSVVKYANALLSDSTQSNYHNLVKAMLNYGAAAQNYFGYNTENLANAGIEGFETVDVPTSASTGVSVSGSAEGIEYYGATLVFRDKIAVRFYFSGSSEGIEGAVTKGDLFYVEVADILPQKLDEAVSVTVGGLSVSYSPMNYIVRMNVKGTDEMKALMKALYNYHLAAEKLIAA